MWKRKRRRKEFEKEKGKTEKSMIKEEMQGNKRGSKEKLKNVKVLK